MTGFKFFTGLGRFAIFLSLAALIAAWISQLTNGELIGLSQEHLFNDSIVLALLGIAFLFDAVIHRQEAA